MELLDSPSADQWRLHGSHEPVALASPAAGSALTYTVSGAVQIVVHSAVMLYTASSNAANRIPYLEILDTTGTPVASCSPGFTYVASDAVIVSFGLGQTLFGANSSARAGCGIPEIRLQDGMQVKLGAVGINATDAITKARLYVRQWNVQPFSD